MVYGEQVVRRAWALYCGNVGLTYRYALALVDAELVDEDELRGHGPRSKRRWYAA